MRIYTKDNDFGSSLSGNLYSKVWAQVLDQYLKEYTYMAELATLKFSLTANLCDIDLQWSGFNDSMPNFIKETLSKIGKMKE